MTRSQIWLRSLRGFQDSQKGFGVWERVQDSERDRESTVGGLRSLGRLRSLGGLGDWKGLHSKSG